MEDVDRLDIENLLEAANSTTMTVGDEVPKFTRKHYIKWIKAPFESQFIPFEEESVGNCKENLKTPHQYFKEYFTDGLFEKFANYTNLYAEQETNAAETRVLFVLQMHVVKNLKRSSENSDKFYKV